MRQNLHWMECHMHPGREGAVHKIQELGQSEEEELTTDNTESNL